jgi:hypothetical protein
LSSRARPVNDECIRRDQQYFKEYEEVEKVSGQKSAIDTHDLKQEQRIVKDPFRSSSSALYNPAQKASTAVRAISKAARRSTTNKIPNGGCQAPQGIGERVTLCGEDQYPPDGNQHGQHPQVIQRCMLSRVDRGGNSINMAASDGSNTGRMGKWFMARLILP